MFEGIFLVCLEKIEGGKREDDYICRRRIWKQGYVWCRVELRERVSQGAEVRVNYEKMRLRC